MNDPAQRRSSKLLADLQRNANSFALFNKQKVDSCLSVCSEAQKQAYYLIPFFLHSNSLELFLNGDDFPPAGIHGYQPSAFVKKVIQIHFDREDSFRLRKADPVPPIEFLSLMGSVGTIAFSDRSDFDYWVCLKESVSEGQEAILQKKLMKIEGWCLSELEVEVHFFTMKSSRLVANDFGSVSKESCGSAQVKLLKEEYFRGSVLVMGKIPYWWIIPHEYDIVQSDKLISILKERDDEFKHDYIHIGSCSAIPQGEFLGAGLWQLNKGIMSPYKSILKLALLMTYCEDPSKGWISDVLKRNVQNQLGKVGDHDAYLVMMEQVLCFFESRSDIDHAQEDLDTLKICFFVKIGVKVSTYLNAKNPPSRFRERKMLSYVKKWEWSRGQVEDLEDVLILSAKKSIALKNRLESFLLRGLKYLFDRVGQESLRGVMSEKDESRLLNRLLTIFDHQRDRVEWFYPPFDHCLKAREYSLVEADDGSIRLYKGKISSHSLSAFDENNLLRVESSLVKMGMWLIYNGILDSKPEIHSVISSVKSLLAHLFSLSIVYKSHFGHTGIPSLDGSFAEEPIPQKWILAINVIPNALRSDGRVWDVEPTRSYTDIFVRDRQESFKKTKAPEDMSQQPQKRIDRILGGVDQTKDFKVRGSTSGLEPETTMTVISDPNSGSEKKGQRTALPLGDDVLNAWVQEENLCDSFFLIEKNTWGEVTLHVDHDQDAFIKMCVSLLQYTFVNQLDLKAALEIFVPHRDIEPKRIKTRVMDLLLQVYDLFSSDEYDRPKFFFTMVGGELFVIFKDGDDIEERSYPNLSQATLDINLSFRGAVDIRFDRDVKKWDFHHSAWAHWSEMRDRSEPLDRVHLNIHKGTNACYALLMDDLGHMVSLKLHRDRLRTELPRLIAGVGEQVAHVGKRLSVCWFNRDEKGKGVMDDISEKVIRLAMTTWAKASPLEMVMPWSSALYFLKKYARQGRYGFDSDIVKNELRYVVREVKRMRADPQRKDVIYLTDLELVGDADSSTNVALSVNLKCHLDLACSVMLSQEA